jgi:hypothetical protein
VIGKLPLGLGLVLGSTTITGNGSWAPSDIQHFLANLTSVVTWNLSLRFTAVSGTWQVDDVYLDPMQQRQALRAAPVPPAGPELPANGARRV